MTAYDRPRRWSAHNGGPVEVTVTIHLEPVSEGTQLFSNFDAQPHGLFRLLFPLFLKKIRKEEKANMGYLKAALERRVDANLDS